MQFSKNRKITKKSQKNRGKTHKEKVYIYREKIAAGCRIENLLN